jgi:muconolactone delta-isomerase
MKFLTIGSPKAIPVPPDQAVKLYPAAMAWIDQQIKSGKIEAMYIFPEGGGMAISDVNSQEEAFDLLTSYPLYSFFDWKVQALVDWKYAYNSIIERYKSMVGK